LVIRQGDGFVDHADDRQTHWWGAMSGIAPWLRL
jgi:hypothetical protein